MIKMDDYFKKILNEAKKDVKKDEIQNQIKLLRDKIDSNRDTKFLLPN